jgi:transcriptional regulator with PAS, ATPase and Fis domain
VSKSKPRKPVQGNMPVNQSNLFNPKLSNAFATNREQAMKKTIIPAIEAEGGNMNAAARRLGISIDTLRRWVDKEPALTKALTSARIAALIRAASGDRGCR